MSETNYTDNVKIGTDKEYYASGKLMLKRVIPMG